MKLYKHLKCVVGILFYLFLLALITSCARNANSDFPDIPDNIMNLYTNYMVAAQKGATEAATYRYFVNEQEEKAFSSNENWKILEYQLNKAEKLSDFLYAFTSDIKSNEGKAKVYYFAAWFQEEWNFVLNIQAVPEAIKKDIDIEEYTYDVESVPYDAIVVGT